MTDNTKQRHSGAGLTELAGILEQLYRQGLALIADAVQPAPDSGAAADVDLDELLAVLKAQSDQVFNQWRQQIRSLELPQEAIVAGWAQLNSLQELGERQFAASALAAIPPGMLPRLGMFQQRQEQLDAVARAMGDLREAQEEYLALLRRISDDGLDEFRRALREHEDGHLGLRQLYDLWLQASESAYERVLVGDAYAAALGRLANASAAMTQQVQETVDDLLLSLNLPTRREMNSTQQRLHELRRQQRAQRAAADEVQSLRQEMAELRAELARLRRKPRRAPARGKKQSHVD